MTNMNKALKNQEEEKRIKSLEDSLKTANLIISAKEHEGVKELVRILQHHIDHYNDQLLKQRHDNGERFTVREIDQIVNLRDSYQSIISVFDIAEENKNLTESKLEKIKK